MVEALAARRRMEEAEAAANCTEVNTIAVQLNSLVLVSPESPQVLFYCDRIIASNHLVCTEAEKDNLKKLDAMFEKAVDALFAEIWTAIELLETLEAATVYGNDQSYFSYVKDGKIINFHSISKRFKVQNIKK